MTLTLTTADRVRTPAAAVRDVTKTYGRGDTTVCALDDVSLGVARRQPGARGTLCRSSLLVRRDSPAGPVADAGERR
jgi:hypothetical protein